MSSLRFTSAPASTSTAATRVVLVGRRHERRPAPLVARPHRGAAGEQVTHPVDLAAPGGADQRPVERPVADRRCRAAGRRRGSPSGSRSAVVEHAVVARSGSRTYVARRCHHHPRSTRPRPRRARHRPPPRRCARRHLRVVGMRFRYLGNSGLKISEITYGNWLTHGSQVENEAAVACVRAALDAGITTFDTADVYANTKAETVLGDALKGERRAVAGDLHQGLLADRPRRPQRHRPVPQAHPRVDRRVAAAAADRLRRPLPGAPLRHRDAARGDDAGLRRRRPRRQGALHRRQRVDRRPDPRRARARAGPRRPADLVAAAVLHALAGHRGPGRPDAAASSVSRRSSGRRSPRACSRASTCRGRRRRPARAPPTRRVAPT